MAKYDLSNGSYAGPGARVGIAASRFNQHLVSKLLEGAFGALKANGIDDNNVQLVRVSGAFELPLAAQRLAQDGNVDAVICLGAVVRGDTPHFEFVAGECARGLLQVSLSENLPVIFGVITTNTEEQAEARCGGSEGNKGAEAAMAALESLNALAEIKHS